jgi:hypothetical protein
MVRRPDHDPVSNRAAACCVGDDPFVRRRPQNLGQGDCSTMPVRTRRSPQASK